MGVLLTQPLQDCMHIHRTRSGDLSAWLVTATKVTDMCTSIPRRRLGLPPLLTAQRLAIAECTRALLSRVALIEAALERVLAQSMSNRRDVELEEMHRTIPPLPPLAELTKIFALTQEQTAAITSRLASDPPQNPSPPPRMCILRSSAPPPYRLEDGAASTQPRQAAGMEQVPAPLAVEQAPAAQSASTVKEAQASPMETTPQKAQQEGPCGSPMPPATRQQPREQIHFLLPAPATLVEAQPMQLDLPGPPAQLQLPQPMQQQHQQLPMQPPAQQPMLPHQDMDTEQTQVHHYKQKNRGVKRDRGLHKRLRAMAGEQQVQDPATDQQLPPLYPVPTSQPHAREPTQRQLNKQHHKNDLLRQNISLRQQLEQRYNQDRWSAQGDQQQQQPPQQLPSYAQQHQQQPSFQQQQQGFNQQPHQHLHQQQQLPQQQQLGFNQQQPSYQQQQQGFNQLQQQQGYFSQPEQPQQLYQHPVQQHQHQQYSGAAGYGQMQLPPQAQEQLMQQMHHCSMQDVRHQQVEAMPPQPAYVHPLPQQQQVHAQQVQVIPLAWEPGAVLPLAPHTASGMEVPRPKVPSSLDMLRHAMVGLSRMLEVGPSPTNNRLRQLALEMLRPMREMYHLARAEPLVKLPLHTTGGAEYVTHFPAYTQEQKQALFQGMQRVLQDQSF